MTAPGAARPGAARGQGAALPRDPREAAERAAGRDRRARTVRAGLEEVAAEYGAEEVIVVTITHDHGARRRSSELIADAFELAVVTERTLQRQLQA